MFHLSERKSLSLSGAWWDGIIGKKDGKMMNRYVFGFSLIGLILYALQLLPNIFWLLTPPANNVLAENSSAYQVFNIIEQVFGIMTVALLILLINKDGGRSSSLYVGLAILFLAGYYSAWIFYYQGVVSPWLLIIGIAAMPPLYFFFVGLWLENYIALIPCAIFGVTHIAVTCTNYLKMWSALWTSLIQDWTFLKLFRT